MPACPPRPPTSRLGLRLASLLIAGLAGAAWASPTLQPAPAAGLWMQRATMKLNGQDLGASMRAMQAEMLKKLTPEQRAQAEAMLKNSPMAGGETPFCLSAEDARQAADPKTVLAQLQQENARCRFEPVKVEGGTLSYRGECRDPEGYTGPLEGRLSMQGPKAWSAQHVGLGSMASAEEMPGAARRADGKVELRIEVQARWTAEACPASVPRAGAARR